MNKISLLKTCNITTGKKDSNASVIDGKYPFFTCAPEPLKIDTFCFDDDVILLAGNNAGGNFHCQRYSGKFDAYQRTYVLTAKEGYDLDFVYYSLLMNLKQYAKKSQGSQTKFLTMKILEDFEIDDIQYNEQKNISKILKCIDTKINNNLEINSELESMAKTLYDYWFLQFEFPNADGKPYKSSGGKMVYNEQLKKEIPEGWEIVELGSQIFENNKSTIQVNDVENIGKIPFFTSGEEILNCSEKMVSGLNIYMSTGGNASIKIYFGDAAYSTDTWCINAGVNTLFYYEYLMTIKHQINDNYFDGSGLKHLKKDAFKKILLYIPKIDIVEKFNQIVEKYFQLISQKTLENKDLTELRDFLLPLLMNGQVTFKDKDEKENQPIILNYMDKFNRWKETQGYAARGDVDDDILKKIYDSMDDDDKK